MPTSLASWLAYIEHQHPKSIAMGLERVGEVAGRMGLEKPATHVITVGGTNGKGSTVAFVEAIARAAGWKVGAYTSPHLFAYNERVRLHGVDATDGELVAAFEAIEAARGDIALTYFEFGTLAALQLFAAAGLDLAVLEVGLGGRLDAVNLVDADVAVITTVDLDHQEYLGDNREQIGSEKVGIARAWKPLILGEDDPPSSVLGRAYAIGASTWRANNDFFFEPINDRHWCWREVGHAIELPMPGLAGPSQLRNAATAIAALRALDAPIADSAIAAGVATARLPGRLQSFVRDGVEIIVDVGHNPQAARELAAWLSQSPAQARTWAIYAALADKDLLGVVDALSGQVDRWLLAGLEQVGPRGIAVMDFAQRLAGTAAGSGDRHPDVESALAAAQAQARPGDRVLVFGSFHTAAEALQALGAGGNSPAREP